MNNAGSQTNGSIKDAQRAVQSVGSSVGDLRSSLSDAGQQVGSAAKKVISDVTQSGRDMAGEYIEEGKKLAKDYVEEGKKGLEGIENFAKEKPITAILLSVGAGILLARCLK